MSEDTMLADAVQKLSGQGATVHRVVDDKLQGRGKTHAIIEVEQQMFSLRAKEYRYQGNSSFGVEQVEEADQNDFLLVSYIQQIDDFFVFDPEYVLEYGSEYQQPSKKSDGRTWIEVDSSAGVVLNSYLYGSGKPETLAGDNATLSSF